MTWPDPDSSVAFPARVVAYSMVEVRRELLGGERWTPGTLTRPPQIVGHVPPCDDVAELNAAYEWLTALSADVADLCDRVRERLLLFHAEEVEALGGGDAHRCVRPGCEDMPPADSDLCDRHMDGWSDAFTELAP